MSVDILVLQDLFVFARHMARSDAKLEEIEDFCDKSEYIAGLMNRDSCEDQRIRDTLLELDKKYSCTLARVHFEKGKPA